MPTVAGRSLFCRIFPRTEEQTVMGEFLLGLIIGVAGTLAVVIYDEGEIFLKLHAAIKRTMDRYKHQAQDSN
jgi:hypothetical protein